MLEKIHTILDRLEYPIGYNGPNYVSTTALFRGGDNPNAVLCYDDGPYDQIEGKKYQWPEFVAKVKKITIKEAEEWLKGAEVEDGEEREEAHLIKLPKTLVESDYADLVKSYKFFLDRGISEEVLDYYQAGLAQGGPMYGRVTFKIRDDKGKLIGVAGRDALKRDLAVKWKNKGQKSEWVYPTFDKNTAAIKETRQIVLVESIGDMLALSNAGIWQVLVNFGLYISPARLAYFLKMNPAQIFIGLNDDDDKKENWGQVAGGKLIKKLESFFFRDKIINAPPFSGDFGAMKPEEILQWVCKYKVQIS